MKNTAAQNKTIAQRENHGWEIDSKVAGEIVLRRVTVNRTLLGCFKQVDFCNVLKNGEVSYIYSK